MGINREQIGGCTIPERIEEPTSNQVAVIWMTADGLPPTLEGS